MVISPFPPLKAGNRQFSLSVPALDIFIDIYKHSALLFVFALSNSGAFFCCPDFAFICESLSFRDSLPPFSASFPTSKRSDSLSSFSNALSTEAIPFYRFSTAFFTGLLTALVRPTPVFSSVASFVPFPANSLPTLETLFPICFNSSPMLSIWLAVFW